MQNMKKLLMGMLFVICLILPCTVSALPEEINLWGQEPVETKSATRQEIVLNGCWKFMPALGSSEREPQEDAWGSLWVPGTWRQTWGVYFNNMTYGVGDNWQVPDFSQLSMGWFERDIFVPADWKGKEVVLNLTRISTDAIVYVDDVMVGSLNWPGGEIEITDYVKYGEKSVLRILIAVTDDGGTFVHDWGNGEISIQTSSVTERGIINDVLLQCRNDDNYIDDMWVRTYVGEKRMEVDLDFKEVTQKQTVDVTFDIVDWKTNKLEKTITQQIEVEPGDNTQTAYLDYMTERLWDVYQPNLYNLVVTVKGPTIDDQYIQRFGFREFEIRGKDFYLNGTLIHLRNWMWANDAEGVHDITRQKMQMFIDLGINCMEIWPANTLAKGTLDFYPTVTEIADEMGLLIIVDGCSVDNWIPWRGIFPKGGYEEWRALLEEYVKIYRNNPSNICWAATANRYGHGNTLNPTTIGNYERLQSPDDYYHVYQLPDAYKIFDAYREIDPTRPVLAHHGANLGDIHSSNIYLNFIQLQEREDWLSAWAESGDMPFLAVEFGTPLNLSYGKTRNQERAMAFNSEPLATEYAAIYLGNDTFISEDNTTEGMAYKRGFAKNYHDRGRSFHLSHEYMHKLDSFMETQDLFITNVIRAWRTYGIAGGVIPWWQGHGWDSIPNDYPQPTGFKFTPGQRGFHSTSMRPMGFMMGLTDQFINQAGRAVVDVYTPSYAYIVGAGESFSLKDHHYYSGGTLKKQVAILNDYRDTLSKDYSIKWVVEVDGVKIKGGGMSGQIETGGIKFVPFETALPKVTETTDGVVSIEVYVGDALHTDEFQFRIYPQTEKISGTYMAFDPEGVTSAYLESLGATLIPWDKNSTESDTLIIGRNALPDIRDQVQDVLTFARNGGKVILFGQQEDIIEDDMDLRVVKTVARRMWPIENMKDHPIITGLDGEDFRDWNGSGSLLPFSLGTEYEEYVQRAKEGMSDPRDGFHWGNRGSVSSRALEKIENSTWRPILEGEFEMNFSPLMEKSIGKGYMLWCTLDVEGRTDVEPVADIVTTRMLEYVKDPEIIQEVKTYLIGDSSYADEVGLKYEKANAMPSEPALVVLGRGHGISDEVVKSYIAQGGNVVILGTDIVSGNTDGTTMFGLEVATSEYNGSLENIEYPEFKSISMSDTRVRSPFNVPLLKPSTKAQVFLNGAAARIEDKGVAVLFQLTPDMFDVVTNEYLRYSQWHNSYMINHVLANLGANFTADDWVWTFNATSLLDKMVSVYGGWSYKEEFRVPEQPSSGNVEDPGNAGFNNGWHLPELDDSDWGDVDTTFDMMASYEGVVWFRKTIDIPADMLDRDLMLSLGAIDDCDITYFNGVEVGRVGKETPEYYAVKRMYNIPKELLREGENVIAIRCFDDYGGGGLYGNQEEMNLIRYADEIDFARPYHLGYNYTFDEGDDPYRFHSW